MSSKRPVKSGSAAPSKPKDTVMVRVPRVTRDFFVKRAKWGESIGDVINRIVGIGPNGEPVKTKATR